MPMMPRPTGADPLASEPPVLALSSRAAGRSLRKGVCAMVTEGLERMEGCDSSSSEGVSLREAGLAWKRVKDAVVFNFGDGGGE